jgi:hypothetical protein
MKDYIASDYDNIGILLLVDAEEYSADDAPNFWRAISTGFEDPPAPGNLLCMKCHQFVDLRISDMTLWCDCAECGLTNIESVSNDEGDE